MRPSKDIRAATDESNEPIEITPFALRDVYFGATLYSFALNMIGFVWDVLTR